MFTRTLLPFAMTVTCLVLAAHARGDDTIPVNEPFKGKTVAEERKAQAQKLTFHTLPVDLKSGQKVDIEVTLVGKGGAAVVIANSDGKILGASWKLPKVATQQFRFGGKEELNWTPEALGTSNYKVEHPKPNAHLTEPLIVPATGQYTVVVMADVASNYTITVKASGAKRDAEAVQKELDAAKKKVAELEKELGDLKDVKAKLKGDK